MVCIQDIPSEIWLAEIVPRTDPMSVLFLGQTSCALRSMLSRKAVWADVLRSACLVHGLFLASYPIDNMSLADLQRASTNPGRWDALVRKWAVPLRELKDAQSLPVRASRLLGDWSEYNFDLFEVRVFLVPGGRFLVAIRARSSPKASRLELWDLGTPVGEPVSESAPIMLAHRDLEDMDPEGTGGDLLVAASKKFPNELRVAVSFQLAVTGVETRVFSIVCSERSPQFQPLATARFKGDSEPATGGFIHGDFMVFRSYWGESFILWNYVEGWFVRVGFHRSGSDQAVRRDIVMLTDDYVLHLRDGVSAWRLSRLCDLGVSVSSSSIKIHAGVTPDWTCPLPVRVKSSKHTSTILSPVRCTIGVQPAITFDVLTGRSGLWAHNISFHRYALTMPSSESSSAFRFAHVEKGVLPFGHFPAMVFHGGRIRGNGVNITTIGPRSRTEWSPEYPDQTFICLPTQSVGPTGALGDAECSQSSPTSEDIDKVMATPLETLRPLASCWASGRFIYHSRDRDSGAVSLLLANYF